VPPRKKASPALPRLTDADIDALRARVQAGDKPRVVVRAASAAVPAGTRGNILRIGKRSEGEYVVVRLGKDEVPFAPAELAMSTRQAANGQASKPAKATPAAPAKKAAPAAKKAAAPARSAAPAKSATAAPPAAKKAATPRPAPTPAAAAKKTIKRAATAKRTPPPLVVTLRFNDGEWSVEAARGSRRLAKPSGVRPGAVKAFADLLDEEIVRDALTETIESCRSVVEERAASLRAELEAAEAALKEYEARRR
jgi:hypothetical protein